MFLPLAANGAQCKAQDGNWYPYNHPMCGGEPSEYQATPPMPNYVPNPASPIPSHQSMTVQQDGECPFAIETKIDGEFEGWDGETLFKLENGQIWQQTSYAYTYHYAYRPDVVIYPTRRGCEMQVEGTRGAIAVIRLR
jgi:hypothetical protein